MSGRGLRGFPRLGSMWARQLVFVWRRRSGDLRRRAPHAGRLNMMKRCCGPSAFHGFSVSQFFGVDFKKPCASRRELRPVKTAELELPFQIDWFQLAAGNGRLGFGLVD